MWGVEEKKDGELEEEMGRLSSPHRGDGFGGRKERAGSEKEKKEGSTWFGRAKLLEGERAITALTC